MRAVRTAVEKTEKLKIKGTEKLKIKETCNSRRLK